MTNLIAGGVCCCFACCCQECADGCKRWLGPEKVTKINYLFLILVFVIPAIFVFFFLNDWQQFFKYFYAYFHCPQSSGGGQFGCVGSSAVFRLSLCLLILFVIMMLFMACRIRLSMVINEGCFCFKYLLVVGLFIGSLWINNTVFEGYATASQYISIVFMVLQCIILIDLFYLAGIQLVKKYDNQDGQQEGYNHQYACYLIFLTLIFYSGAITFNVLGYMVPQLTNNANCGSTIWVNIITSIMLVVLPAIQLLNFNQQNSLLTTSLVSLYIAYLSFFCQFSYSDSELCNRMEVGPFVADIAVSLFFFILTLYGSIMGGTGQVKVTRNGDINKAMGVTNKDRDQNPNQYSDQLHKPHQQDTDEQQQYTESYDWVKWHFYMCLAAIYVGMLITNWNSANVIQLQLQPSESGFWVRLVIGWATFLLYIWTMVAPRVCPSRDFRVQ